MRIPFAGHLGWPNAIFAKALNLVSVDPERAAPVSTISFCALDTLPLSFLMNRRSI